MLHLHVGAALARYVAGEEDEGQDIPRDRDSATPIDKVVEDESQHSVGADMAVLHDGEDLLLRPSTTKAIEEIP